jgi:hypothetical protein
MDLVSQLLALTGAHSTPPHLAAIGLEEQGYHLVRQGLPILTSLDSVVVPGGVLRPLVDPAPLYAWSVAWRGDVRGGGPAAIREAAAELATAHGWLSLDPGHATWLPEPEASRMAARDLRMITDDRRIHRVS